MSINEDNDNLMSLNYTTCQVTLQDEKTLWIEPELIVDMGCELPQLDNSRFYGKFYRIFYAINTDVDYQHCGAVRSYLFFFVYENMKTTIFLLFT